MWQDKRLIYKHQVFFYTLALDNPKNEIKRQSHLQQQQKKQFEMILAKEVPNLYAAHYKMLNNMK